MTEPKRASSGPASRKLARIRLHNSVSSSRFVMSAACTRTECALTHSTSAPTSASSSSIVATSRMVGTFVSVTG